MHFLLTSCSVGRLDLREDGRDRVIARDMCAGQKRHRYRTGKRHEIIAPRCTGIVVVEVVPSRLKQVEVARADTAWCSVLHEGSASGRHQVQGHACRDHLPAEVAKAPKQAH